MAIPTLSAGKGLTGNFLGEKEKAAGMPAAFLVLCGDYYSGVSASSMATFSRSSTTMTRCRLW